MTNNGFIYLFLKLNLWLCLASVVMVVATAMALGIPLESVGLGIALAPLLFYFIYVEDRREVSAEDLINDPYRSQVVRRYREKLLITEALALGGYEVLLVFLLSSRSYLGIEGFLLGQFPLVVLLSYSTLKRYAVLDSAAVALTWAFVIVFSVLVTTPARSLQVVVVFAAWFLIVFAGVESRNIQDAEGDVEADKTTLAARFGARVTRAMEATLKVAGVAIFWYVSGLAVALVVVLYLLLLRLFRRVTRTVSAPVTDVDVANPPEGDSLSPAASSGSRGDGN